MDPSATLLNVLEILHAIQTDSSEEVPADRDEVSEGLRNLADWISNRGFPPNVGTVVQSFIERNPGSSIDPDPAPPTTAREADEAYNNGPPSDADPPRAIDLKGVKIVCPDCGTPVNVGRKCPHCERQAPGLEIDTDPTNNYRYFAVDRGGFHGFDLTTCEKCNGIARQPNGAIIVEPRAKLLRLGLVQLTTLPMELGYDDSTDLVVCHDCES